MSFISPTVGSQTPIFALGPSKNLARLDASLAGKSTKSGLFLCTVGSEADLDENRKCHTSNPMATQHRSRREILGQLFFMSSTEACIIARRGAPRQCRTLLLALAPIYNLKNMIRFSTAGE